ncbi:MAG: hypothetical protein KC912_13915 [Proteobacteria bacterium]|nr:hypothetical protein [Pseudomonadota bacterium]
MASLDRALAIQIAEQPDPVLRNLQITWGYHQLALGLTARLGEDNVPWPAFGVWASQTAGRFIREEGLPAIVDDLVDGLADGIDRVTDRLPSMLRPRLHHAPRDLVQAITGDVAAQLALGNQRIWAELGPLFLEMNEVLDGDRDFAVFAEQLRPGHASVGGQAFLHEGFTHLLAARDLSGKARAERIYAFNALIGLHEQIRIQAQIEAALSAPVDTVIRVLDALDDDSDDGWLEAMAERAVAKLLSPLVEVVTVRVRRRLTRHVMTFDLPHQSLPLGRDLDARTTVFPADLRELVSPAALMVEAIVDQSPGTLDGTAAADWADLTERMDFIVDVFRSRQQTPVLLRPPYAPDQVASLLALQLPAGPL